MLEVAIIILCALIAAYIFNKIGLPGLLGMIITGIVLGPSGLNLVSPEVHSVLKEFKTAALIVILFRAGLGINKETLNRIGGPAIRLSFIPAVIEGTTITLISHFLFNITFYEAGMLGFIIAAVSPAVVVPTMLDLKDKGYGKDKEIPTLVLAGASLDDVFAITIFSVFASLAASGTADWTFVFLGVPTGILLGAGIGIGIGYLFVWYFKKFHLRDTMKVIIFMIVAVILYDLTELPEIKNVIPIASLLGIMAIGFVLLEKYDVLANRMAAKFNKIWVLAEILLFVYIGTEVKLDQIDLSILGTGILILTIGLIIRSVGVWISLFGSELNNKEKIFCMIAYLPKATVQAAMGAVPLTMILDGRISSSTVETGQLILSMAVLSIIFAAPLGAIGIKLGGKRLLDK